jgi:hypothetical protein
MEGPVITVSAGETLWLEGRALKFQSAARVQLPHGTRFIRGRDVLAAEADGSPELDAYLAIQAAHLASRGEYHRLHGVAQAKLAELDLAAVEVTLALRALAMHRSHHALLALRPLVAHHAADEQPAALCA